MTDTTSIRLTMADDNQATQTIAAALAHVTTSDARTANGRELTLRLEPTRIGADTDAGRVAIGLEGGLVVVELPTIAATLARLHARPVRSEPSDGGALLFYDLARPVSVRLPWIGRLTFERAPVAPQLADDVLEGL